MNKYYDSFFYRYIGSAFTNPKNFFLCLKYPFLKSRNVWTGRFSGYNSTMYEWIPVGWRAAFGKELVDDIAKALKEDKIPKRKWCKSVYWEDIKEKYGTLRLYAATTNKVQKVLSKYEAMSYGYCITCGKPARYMTHGWIEFLCEDCFDSIYSDPEYKSECRLSNKDMPTCYISGDYETERTMLEVYGVDLEKLWGLKENK